LNLLDISIIIFVVYGAILGFKRGFTKEVVKALGFIAVIVVAYFLKNPISVFFYEKLQFFKFGLLKNMEILNILLYETLAFILCIIVLSLVLKVISMVSSILEKIFNATVILGIPSKIAGALVGCVYNFIISFLILYALTFTLLDNGIVANSKFRTPILNNTPVLSSLIDKSMNVIDEFMVLKDKYSDKSISENEFNYQAFDLFLRYKVVKPTTLEKLIENGKIESFEGCIELIAKYKEEQNGTN